MTREHEAEVRCGAEAVRREREDADCTCWSILNGWVKDPDCPIHGDGKR